MHGIIGHQMIDYAWHCRRSNDRLCITSGADPEKNLTGFQSLIIIAYTDTCIYIVPLEQQGAKSIFD